MLLNATCFGEKQQIPRSTALEASTITITPPDTVVSEWTYLYELIDQHRILKREILKYHLLWTKREREDKDTVSQRVRLCGRPYKLEFKEKHNGSTSIFKSPNIANHLTYVHDKRQTISITVSFSKWKSWKMISRFCVGCFCGVFCRSFFVLFLLAIVLYVLLPLWHLQACLTNLSIQRALYWQVCQMLLEPSFRNITISAIKTGLQSYRDTSYFLDGTLSKTCCLLWSTVCRLFELQPDNRHRGPLSNPPYEESSVGSILGSVTSTQESVINREGQRTMDKLRLMEHICDTCIP
jgi:hypothetical protein